MVAYFCKSFVYADIFIKLLNKIIALRYQTLNLQILAKIIMTLCINCEIEIYSTVFYKNYKTGF